MSKCILIFNGYNDTTLQEGIMMYKMKGSNMLSWGQRESTEDKVWPQNKMKKTILIFVLYTL